MKNKMKNKLYLLTAILSITVFSGINTMAQSGGDFEITQSVVAGGGGTTSDMSGILTLDSAIGQPIATTNISISSIYTLRSGFWTPAPFGPTAGQANIQGRVIFGKSSGIRNAIVALSGGALTEPLVAYTGSFGYFTFNDVQVGHFYILTVRHGKYQFIQNTQAFTLLDDIEGIIFHAD